MQGFEAKIHVEADATPRFCRARTVPYAMRQLVEEELRRLVAERTLEPVESPEWADPIVAVLKPDKKECAHLWRLQDDGEPGFQT